MVAVFERKFVGLVGIVCFQCLLIMKCDNLKWCVLVMECYGYSG
jgi:hypothetical protein